MPVATPFPLDLRCQLGEGPTWDAERGVAHVVDIDTGILWEVAVDPMAAASVVLRCDTTLGAAVHAADGGFLLAAGGALRHVDAEGATVREFPLVAPGIASRLNDGVADPAGRFVVGSLAQDDRRGQERLWRLELDGSVTVLDDDLTLSNGLSWSPDGSVFYSVDSVPGTVWVRDYDVDTGRTAARHRLVDIDDGTPDGMTVDEEGNLWIAIWGRGEVRGYSPSGTQLDVISVGAPHTTCCEFVGADLRTLLITTAGKEVDGRPSTPICGALFQVELPVAGRPTTAWCPVA